MELDRRLLLAGLAGLAAAPASAQPKQVAAKAAAEVPLASRLAAYTDSIRSADLDAATIERAKLHLLDSLGCGLAAFRETTVNAVRELAFASGGTAATIIGTKRRATLEWAAFANGAGIRADDINDVYVGLQAAHPSDNRAVCRAAAQAMGATGSELLLSIVLAYEIECRLLDVAYLDRRGWDHPNFALISGVIG